MAEFTNIEEKTRAIYVEQHKAYTKDRTIFDRFYSVAADCCYYDVSEGFFKAKLILDAGCGNTAYFQKAMYDLGAKHVVCVDIGEEWKSELASALDGLGVPASFYTLVSASTTNLPLDSDSMDFVASNGVLMHLEGIANAEMAMSELARVTAKGGSLFAYVGINEPGIVDRYIVPALRTAYKEDPAFGQFIDALDPASLQGHLKHYVTIAANNDSSIDQDLARAFVGLFTLDTCTFFQNMLQVPITQAAKLGMRWGVEQFERHGFVNVRRTPGRYWKRNDVRKFLAPVHFDITNPVTRIFYGDGHIRLIGEKADPRT